MFKKLKSMDTQLHNMWILAILSIVASVLFSAWAIWYAIRASHRANLQVYVLSSGDSMHATATDPQEILPVEARDHLRNFHHLFFDLSPDEKGIKASIDRSLYLADASAKVLYDNLLESGFINGLISGNITQSVTLDSIWVDTRADPYEFRCIGVQTLIRQTSLTTRSMMTHGFLRRTGVKRSDNNPHGFIIERLEVEQNKEIKTVSR
jgi:conjugative transposon TraK protein